MTARVVHIAMATGLEAALIKGEGQSKESRSIETSAEFCERTLCGIKRKADRNKTEALILFSSGTAATLVAPLFITLGAGFFWGKVVPSSMALVATFCTAWLQLRRPQLLWALYRGAQRELEDQLTRHRFRVGDYEGTKDPDKRLAEQVANIALDLHHKWAPLVPHPETLAASAAVQRGQGGGCDRNG